MTVPSGPAALSCSSSTRTRSPMPIGARIGYSPPVRFLLNADGQYAIGVRIQSGAPAVAASGATGRRKSGLHLVDGIELRAPRFEHVRHTGHRRLPLRVAKHGLPLLLPLIEAFDLHLL